MECVGYKSADASERRECAAQGYRRLRCRACGKQFNERSAGSLNRTRHWQVNEGWREMGAPGRMAA
jgi:putative transposase